ncbi:MAG: major facilitator superfamily 1 [Chthonomonadales bacterium]|nr:major facilitator superfamily 1 [Chthonomonadales bacterium]
MEAVTVVEKDLVRKVTWRLIPFLFLLYVIAYLDRSNVGFAKLGMKDVPWFNEAVYGFGAGIFFIGYFLFEVPSNLLLERFGARKWIARIMFTWGVIAMAMLCVNSKSTFYGMRFLLGLAEAGFFPGVILYMTYWFTAKERAQIVALFMTANAVCFIFGGPISGWILDHAASLGYLKGWQWLFLLEGFPAILLGFVVLAYLPDGPAQAKWLLPQERDWIIARYKAEQSKISQGHPALRDALMNPHVWLFCGLYFTLVVGMYGLGMWLPTIVKEFNSLHLTGLQTGLISSVPFLISGTCMVINGWHSDKTNERRLHITVPAILGGCGLVMSAYLENPWMKLASLALAAAGMWSTLGPFWSLPTSILAGTAAAGGIAFINSVGNLGGFLGPYMVGYIKDHSHDPNQKVALGLVFLACSVFLGAGIALLVPKRKIEQVAEATPVFVE